MRQTEKAAILERNRGKEIGSIRKSVWEGERAQKLEEQAEAAEVEKRKQEVSKKAAELERKRELYGFKDWKQANRLPGEADEVDVRAAQVAAHDAAAGDREESLAAMNARKKEARVADIARQRKAYGLHGQGGHTLGAGTPTCARCASRLAG